MATTRFIVTDHTAASHAAAELPTAARRLATITAEVAEPLMNLRAAAEPAEVLAAFGRWQRSQSRLEPARAEIVCLLHRAGASPRGIADAVGMHRSAVDRLIAIAEAEVN
ncbi:MULTISPECIES: hypothetical protein [Mycolicibacterium]|uniref:hypothetical protein n=1 Tax=Mycolicibacterium TaxID=1866885 RepID=UPI0007EB19CC|nr:hypothetical protein [Mycolicibacterium fortuitum]OBG24064.1 hypothetical protein A5768_22075 [Mycolicibacterium fortuitum]